MNPDRWRQVDDLLQAALERPAAEREAFLRHACEDDEALAREARSLLASYLQSGRFLERPALDVAARSLSRGPGSDGRDGDDDPDSVTMSGDRGGPPGADRFIPGSKVGGRYRIVSLIGQGGMGEVYRADDLRLGLRVALKFLPERIARDPARLARFHHEVRLAREVSHPHVCRVHDIGDADGQPFLSMEYVDGEDLASLLRRIGRLPAAKALEIAQQLCAGLAAAHDRGVLHRDLKPANVLIDGGGFVRIVDFGVAALAGDPDDAELRAGTPAYMAPEQLAGRPASMQSDLYALGLILYEVLAGRPAFDAATPERMPAAPRRSAPPIELSRVIPDVDPGIERLILWCLEADPARRPPSARAVSAALPGGGSLTAMLTAGRTPSPDMIAATGEAGSISTGIGLACLAAIAICLIAVAWMSNRTTLASFLSLDRTAEALAERARTIAHDLGYTGLPADRAYGYQRDDDQLRYIEEHDVSPARWAALRAQRWSPISLWYRQSPRHLASPADFFAHGRITRTDPPETVPGMLSMVVDPAGRLRNLTVVPSRVGNDADQAGARDIGAHRQMTWRMLFEQADLPIDRFTPVASSWRPPVYADARAAWEGSSPDRPDIPLRVEAAAAGDNPVYFAVIAPWTRPPDLPPAATARQRLRSAIELTVIVGALFAAVLMAVRNLRMGRGDRRGAFRVSAFVMTTTLLAGALSMHDIVDLLPRQLVLTTLAAPLLPYALWYAVIVWVTYIAIEPFARRVWPEALVGWNRALAGRFGNPLVGRDVLIGVVWGTALASILHLVWLATDWFGAPPPPLGGTDVPLSRLRLVTLLLGGRHAAAQAIDALDRGLTTGLGAVMFAVLFTVLARGRRRVATAVFVILALLPSVAAGGAAFAVAAATVASSAVVLMRFGMLPFMVGAVFFRLLTIVPFTVDSSAPGVFASYLILGMAVAAAGYGFRTATARHPDLWDPPLRGPRWRASPEQ